MYCWSVMWEGPLICVQQSPALVATGLSPASVRPDWGGGGGVSSSGAPAHLQWPPLAPLQLWQEDSGHLLEPEVVNHAIIWWVTLTQPVSETVLSGVLNCDTEIHCEERSTPTINFLHEKIRLNFWETIIEGFLWRD